MPDVTPAPTAPTRPVHADSAPRASTRGTGPRRSAWPVVFAVSAGGVVGALARYAIAAAWPAQPERFPWSTFTVNVSGCLLIGVLLVLADRMWAAPRFARAFLGTGVLGGYTSFSAYAVDTLRLVDAGAAGTGMAYLAGTLGACLLAALLGSVVARLLLRIRVILDPVEVIRCIGRGRARDRRS